MDGSGGCDQRQGVTGCVGESDTLISVKRNGNMNAVFQIHREKSIDQREKMRKKSERDSIYV